MSETKRDYAIGYGKPPRGRPLPEGPIRQPARPARKNLPALLVAALNEKVYVTIDGKRRRITKREAIVTQMVNQSASAELRATKMLIDMLKEIERRLSATPPPKKSPFCRTDEEVVEELIARLRRNVWIGKIRGPRDGVVSLSDPMGETPRAPARSSWLMTGAIRRGLPLTPRIRSANGSPAPRALPLPRIAARGWGEGHFPPDRTGNANRNDDR